jgi:hypothetical protein
MFNLFFRDPNKTLVFKNNKFICESLVTVTKGPICFEPSTQQKSETNFFTIHNGLHIGVDSVEKRDCVKKDRIYAQLQLQIN